MPPLSYYSPLMSRDMPQRIDPVTAAEKGRSFDGSCPLSSMRRLSDLLVESTGTARYHLQFAREGGQSIVRGTVAAELVVRCQCCLKAMSLLVDESFALGIVRSLEQADALPEGLEPLLLDGDDRSTSLVEMIEDELLLAVPHVTQHPACASVSTPKAAATEEAPEKRRPFADLSALVDNIGKK